ncbi:hypothetical protein BDN72DRAFT_891126 [Pluteus cervinus]|uniref:Uncharacterized protein n=1 Tax=Pluteus cervinus TaxID=181527 RepID=A0ACD3BGY6_9AGAR|nr:hypothetical protein BDN72DRAFT_891126 [Pluteus cervinus]
MDTSSFFTENNHTTTGTRKRPLPQDPPPPPSPAPPDSKYEWSPNWNVAGKNPLPSKYRKLHRRSPRLYSGSQTSQLTHPMVKTSMKGEPASNHSLSKSGHRRRGTSCFQTPFTDFAHNQNRQGHQNDHEIPFIPLFISPIDQTRTDQMATCVPDSRRQSEFSSFVDAFSTFSIDSRQRTLEWTCHRETKRRRMSTIEESLPSPYPDTDKFPS